MFFQRYNCRLALNLKGSSIYSIKRVPMVDKELDDISLVRNFDKKEESRQKIVVDLFIYFPIKQKKGC